MESITMLTTILVALITAVFGPIAVAWAKKRFESKPTKDPLDESIELNKLVDEQLDIILEDLGDQT